MGMEEFHHMQEVFLWVFGPFVLWALTFMVAIGFFAGMMYLWFGLLRWLSRKEE
jgi:hypothetical protein